MGEGDDNEAALRQFLNGRDAPCPGCGYSLKGLEQSTCPECGRALTLAVVGGTRRPSTLSGTYVFGMAVHSENVVLAAAATGLRFVHRSGPEYLFGAVAIAVLTVLAVRWTRRADEIEALPRYKIQERLAPHCLLALVLFWWVVWRA